jgi:hypothetical protein
MTATTQVPLALSYTEHYINATLEARITYVVDAIIAQDTSDRGAWTYVITKRIALDSAYSEQEVAAGIDNLLRSGALYECCREIRDGIYTMIYVKAEEVAR